MIECVPNLSEGMHLDVINRVAAAAQSEGCMLLDLQMDLDHHRSVLTFAGQPEGLIASIVALTERAIEAIDLTCHRGVHPRMGAVDVVPFVPLAGGSMRECVAAARETGRILAERFELPVYLYEHAAIRPERRNLAEIRRGGLRGVAGRMTQAEWLPDFGPPRVHPTAGVTAVGARDPLVAYNVILSSDDLSAARSIASAIRASSPGGLPGVKALGLRLASQGCVQVSMNLTDIGATDLPAAFGRVRREADLRGLRVRSSEVIGLAPQIAFGGATAEELMLERSLSDLTLEEQLVRHGLMD